jgi:adenosylcobinamide-phosphate synthase
VEPDLGIALAPSVGVLIAALALDLCFGEPPSALHPVVWMGGMARVLERVGLRMPRLGQLLVGGFIALAVPAAFAMTSAVILVAAAVAWPPLQWVVGVLLLKPMFALRELGRAARQVRDSLAAGQLDRARHDLRSLCSRDASKLDPPLLVAGTVESLAENVSDSLVAPLFYYALFGLPGAVLYRAVNTLDAMIGYRGRYEYLGKAAARLDDLLNLLPARVTAVLLLLGGVACGGDLTRGWRVLRRDGGRTESPNAGRPMAAMAGLLGVVLEKPGHYRLGDPIHGLGTQTIDAAWRTVLVSSCLATALFALLIGARHASLG